MEKQSITDILNDMRNIQMLRKEVLTMDEAALYTGFEKSYLYKLCSQKKIAHYKTPGGKMTFFDRKELTAWLKSNRIKPNYEIVEEARQFYTNKIKTK